MYSVLTVADEILKIAKRDGNSLTPMQLMKLTYIAHGWSLGLERGDLFNDRIEAWKYGPVIPDLYQATKAYGRNSIPLDLIDETSTNVSPETKTFLESVYESYKKFDGIQLSFMTHKTGTPWHTVYREGERNIEIKDDLIKRHYKRLFDERSAAAT